MRVGYAAFFEIMADRSMSEDFLQQNKNLLNMDIEYRRWGGKRPFDPNQNPSEWTMDGNYLTVCFGLAPVGRHHCSIKFYSTDSFVPKAAIQQQKINEKSGR